MNSAFTTEIAIEYAVEVVRRKVAYLSSGLHAVIMGSTHERNDAPPNSQSIFSLIQSL